MFDARRMLECFGSFRADVITAQFIFANRRWIAMSHLRYARN